MIYSIRIKCDNAAADGLAGMEVSNILRELATQCEYEPLPASVSLRDSNGNTVGDATLMGGWQGQAMRHYQLVPVRYNAQQLLTRCAPIDAELWSIQWSLAVMSPPPSDLRMHWFADIAPTEYENAQAIVEWMNNRELFVNTLPPLSDIVPLYPRK